MVQLGSLRLLRDDGESWGVMGAVTRVVRGDAAPKGEIV